ncbi:hypothetical protein WMY93_033345 [Mugilogobius chulae]|uniref:Uncharacterized protein n=1 Tax=Mugilogobius chulae TaxID=88201 RepID=A0AAW0MP45_9GOBI
MDVTTGLSDSANWKRENRACCYSERLRGKCFRSQSWTAFRNRTVALLRNLEGSGRTSGRLWCERSGRLCFASTPGSSPTVSFSDQSVVHTTRLSFTRRRRTGKPDKAPSCLRRARAREDCSLRNPDVSRSGQNADLSVARQWYCRYPTTPDAVVQNT